MLKKTTTNLSVTVTSVMCLLITLTTFILGMKYFPMYYDNTIHGFSDLMGLVSLLFGPALIQLSVLIHYWKYHTHG